MKLWAVYNGWQANGCVAVVVEAETAADAMDQARDRDLFAGNGGHDRLKAEPFKLGEVIELG
jgi:hypothetical protein